MRNEEWIDMLKRIPESQRNQMVLVLHNGTEIVIESIFRFEPTFMVIRGRVGGSTDEGRGFFVPYSELLYLRWEKTVKMVDLYGIYGETCPEDEKERDLTVEQNPTTPKVEPKVEPSRANNPSTPSSKVTPAGSTPTDPTSTARTNLLERIRAAKNSVASRQSNNGSS